MGGTSQARSLGPAHLGARALVTADETTAQQGHALRSAGCGLFRGRCSASAGANGWLCVLAPSGYVQVETRCWSSLRLAARIVGVGDTCILLAHFLSGVVFFGRRLDFCPAGAQQGRHLIGVQEAGNFTEVFLFFLGADLGTAPRGTVGYDELNPVLGNSAGPTRAGRTMPFFVVCGQTTMASWLMSSSPVSRLTNRGRSDLHAASEGQQRHDGGDEDGRGFAAATRTHVATDRQRRGAWMFVA